MSVRLQAIAHIPRRQGRCRREVERELEYRSAGGITMCIINPLEFMPARIRHRRMLVVLTLSGS